MPIYEYKCGKCGVIEVMQSIKDGPLKKCPTCKGKVERMISSTSFVLKGTGWYATDYGKKTPPPADTSSANNGGTNGSTSTGEASKPAAEKSASGSETKPAASSDKSSSSTKSAPAAKSE